MRTITAAALVALAFAPACDAKAPDDAHPGEVAPPGEPGAPPGPIVCVSDCVVNHVLGTGQSLALGAVGMPALSTTEPFANTMFDTGIISDGTEAKQFVPLHESQVETMSTAFAGLVTESARALVPDRYSMLVTVHALPGVSYVELKKGSKGYVLAMRQIDAGRRLALAVGKTYTVRAVTTVHGESDHVEGNQSYQANLLEWQADYESDSRAKTGQQEPVPMLQTQMSSWTRQNSTTSTIPIQQLGAHVAAPGKVILVGAKYHLPYADGIHLTNEGYRHMGEDYAKVYRRVVLERGIWEPVRPRAISRTDNVVTVRFHVPAPPLALDTALVSDPGNKGFEVTDDGNTASIVSVAVTGPDTVTITLSSAPTGANRRLRYAYTGENGALAGPTTGPRGNLRDSDATASRYGYALYNWCVHFDEALP